MQSPEGFDVWTIWLRRAWHAALVMLFQAVKSSDPSGSRCTSDGMLEFVVVVALELRPRATSMVSSEKPRREAYGVERTSSVRRTFWARAAVAKRAAVKLTFVNMFAMGFAGIEAG